jgi:hypothetical protein
MPGVPPAVADEHDGLLRFLRQQHQVLRYAAHGLTDSQPRIAASASTLTIGGLLRHVTTMEGTWMARVHAAPQPWVYDLLPFEQRRAAFVDDFTMRADESLAEVLAAYDERCRLTEEAIPGLDLDCPVPVPAAPWFPPDAANWSVRWVLLHLIEEIARHAGHADIVRESIDGATAFPLMAAAEAWPQTPWLTPWSPTASG